MPLYKAVAIVEVALNTSMITTIASCNLYRSKSAGDKDVKSVGLFCMQAKITCVGVIDK